MWTVRMGVIGRWVAGWGGWPASGPMTFSDGPWAWFKHYSAAAAATWMGIEMIILSQTEKDKYCIYLHEGPKK